MVGDPLAVRQELLDFALRLPEAYEDHPWGESVAKVNKKVFAFFGTGEGASRVGFTVKLTDSHDQALSLPCAEPTGYGLARAGWLTIWLDTSPPPTDVCTDWIEESYRLIAPKRLVKLLDG